LLGIAPSPARAQSDAGSRTLAVQLFDEAEALFAKGNVAEACPKHAEIYRVDPQLGVLVYLAECYERNGQLSSAWSSFREAGEVAQKRGDSRGAHVRERASALERRLSRLVIEVPESARASRFRVKVVARGRNDTWTTALRCRSRCALPDVLRCTRA